MVERMFRLVTLYVTYIVIYLYLRIYSKASCCARDLRLDRLEELDLV